MLSLQLVSVYSGDRILTSLGDPKQRKTNTREAIIGRNKEETRPGKTIILTRRILPMVCISYVGNSFV